MQLSLSQSDFWRKQRQQLKAETWHCLLGLTFSSNCYGKKIDFELLIRIIFLVKRIWSWKIESMAVMTFSKRMCFFWSNIFIVSIFTLNSNVILAFHLSQSMLNKHFFFVNDFSSFRGHLTFSQAAFAFLKICFCT